MKKLTAAAALLLAVSFVYLIAQGAQTSSLAPLFPGGALVYIEARELSALLRDWNSSQEKKLWLTSANYDVFSRTRLFMRLAEAQQQFAETAGFAPDMTLVNSISGAQSAIAIYDIGELEFLYVTRMPSARVLASTPFSARTAYESRESAGVTYYVRSGANRKVAAFGTVDGLLFLATRGDLVANALALHARRQTVSPLAQDPWYDAVTRAATNPGEVRIALNMPGLLKTPYFRSYWIQRNASELRPYSAGVIDLYREAQQIREERVLIREQQSTPASEQAVAQVVAWAPADAGLYRAWTSPGTNAVLELIRTKLTNPGVPGEGQSQSAPQAANPDARSGDASDLETRIDQRPMEITATDVTAPLRPVLDGAKVEAMLHVQSSQTAADGVFIGNRSAIALLATNNWPEITLPVVQIHRQGRILVLASDASMLRNVVAQLNRPPATPAAYTARYLHSRELAPFTRMMTQIDAGNTDSYSDGPKFFSENVASLGRVLNRVDSQTITVHDDGARVSQQVVYRFRQP
jgi:hypothetical protein